MRKKKKPFRRMFERTVARREALRGLGALALSWPILSSASCSQDKKSQASTAGAPSVGTPGGTAASSAPASPAASGASSGLPGSTSAPSGNAGGGGAPAASATDAGGVTPAPGGGGGSSGGGGAGASTGGAGSAGGAGDFVPIDFNQVASCTLTPTDPAGEGPFFIHEDEVMNDESIRRSDTREGKPGVELQLNLRVLDSDGGCMTPIRGVEVYVWHTDATGFYSGFNNQNPDMPYAGAIERNVENSDRFCRGVQVTDDQGVVRFRTLYPGWYNGRAIHIHFVALRPGSGPSTMSYRSAQYMVFTTQMYFEEQFSRMIHEHNAPYMARASGTAYATYVKPQNMVVVPTTKMQGSVAVGALNIVTAASGSRR